MSFLQPVNPFRTALFTGNHICQSSFYTIAFSLGHKVSAHMSASSYSTYNSKPTASLNAPWPQPISVTDRKSVFEGRAVPIYSRADAESRLDELKDLDKRLAKASHTIYAWRVTEGLAGHSDADLQSKDPKDSSKKGAKKTKSKSNSGHIAEASGKPSQNELVGQHTDQDFDNGGEPPGGEKLLELLHLTGTTNVLVVVNRWYGGVKIGSDRFKHIMGCGQKALEQEGLFVKKKNKN